MPAWNEPADEYEDEQRLPRRRSWGSDPDEESERWQPRWEDRPKPHSGVGIASTIMGVVTGLLLFVMFAVAGYMESSTPGGIDEESPEAMLVGFGIIGGIGLAVIGGVVGIVGLFLPDRNKLFPTLGLVINGFVAIGTIFLICLGLAMGG